MFDIDLVYTWVDGSDPSFLTEKAKYIGDYNDVYPGAWDQADGLKYSIRGVEEYAPWFRKIFIVTNGQIPRWLSKNEKIQVVTHEEIFRWREHLPVFSSAAIECHLHRIHGLAEHFVYANDDTFIADKVSPQDFFEDDGNIILALESHFDAGDGGSWWASLRESLNLLKSEFGDSTPYFFTHHQMKAYTKTLFAQAEERWEHAFKVTSSRRFRTCEDLALNAIFLHNFAYRIGAGQNVITHNSAFINPGDVKRVESIRELGAKFFCFNNFNDDARINEILCSIFPTPSQFELG